MDNIQLQLERFRKGFPWMEIIAPATPQRGIKVLDEAQVQSAVAYEPLFPVRGKCKFVPASGAATRMFKDIFAQKDRLAAGEDVPQDAALSVLASSIRDFAFYSPDLFGEVSDSAEYRLEVARTLLGPEGLNYGKSPKGVILFHRYEGSGCRTAFAEHLVEGQRYMRNDDGSVNLTVTISPEHEGLFKAELDRIRKPYEERYGVRYNVRFTFQDPSTDTIAVDPDNRPFLKDDGTVLRRPAGHGALIYNLDEVQEELVSIKNIDNVAHERLLPVTELYKKVLMGKCLELRDRIFMYLNELDMVTGEGLDFPEPYPFLVGYNALREDRCATEECQALCQEIERFMSEEMCIDMPLARDCADRVAQIRKKLDRPVRVCGMVRNSGQPGGGPFLIKEKDGSSSLQILESVQINPDDPEAMAKLSAATHFNPVDIVCCMYGYKGRKFNLPEYVDEDAGFISRKSYQGRDLKALELPGLWNGSMSDWNTMFVEVPAETFNPVKVVLDLLKPAHQQ